MMRNKIHNRIGNRNENRSYEEIYANRKSRKSKNRTRAGKTKLGSDWKPKLWKVYTKRNSVDNLPLGPVAPFALLVKFTKFFKHLRKYHG